ncbi:32319_t:CDS:2 [Gigaspora margarita]|uniref:32319_t:CDS:1 n=1 Tax=Gigaspora margarita TaxID=4874 RepID=A0ABN7UZ28_GIGMA|nr:32319_t:CDS:2 [Gigaspora margarita]
MERITIECPNEKEHQVTMDSSPDTNGTEVEIIDTTENDLGSNEDLRDKLNTFSFTNDIKEHVESHILEIAIKSTQPGTLSVVSQNNLDI